MQPDLVIPDECIPFIRMQHSRFNAVKVPDPQEAKRRYAALIYEYFLGMEPHFPARVDTILEIGCGLATIEVFIKRKFPAAHLALLDGDIVTRDGGGSYSDNPDIYNSRAHTEMLLAANGVKVDRWYDVGMKEPLKADFIMSMASWGYHYPFAVYPVEGFVICDLRRANEGKKIASIQAAGGKSIFTGPKYERMAWREPIA
jgi:hypothetical protein